MSGLYLTYHLSYATINASLARVVHALSGSGEPDQRAGKLVGRTWLALDLINAVYSVVVMLGSPMICSRSACMSRCRCSRCTRRVATMWHCTCGTRAHFAL